MAETIASDAIACPTRKDVPRSGFIAGSPDHCGRWNISFEGHVESKHTADGQQAFLILSHLSSFQQQNQCRKKDCGGERSPEFQRPVERSANRPSVIALCEVENRRLPALHSFARDGNAECGED